MTAISAVTPKLYQRDTSRALEIYNETRLIHTVVRNAFLIAREGPHVKAS
jgi:hypothetical protein